MLLLLWRSALLRLLLLLVLRVLAVEPGNDPAPGLC
jgi:hypothetical protein